MVTFVTDQRRTRMRIERIFNVTFRRKNMAYSTVSITFFALSLGVYAVSAKCINDGTLSMKQWTPVQSRCIYMYKTHHNQ